jgi:hypothetical protein
MPDHGVTHGLADGQPHPRRLTRVGMDPVQDYQLPGNAPATTHCPCEVGRTGQAIGCGKHGSIRLPGSEDVDGAGRRARQSTKRTARPGSCDAALTGWLARRACASATESRASWRGDGCWAGTYACSRELLAAVPLRAADVRMGDRKDWLITADRDAEASPGSTAPRYGPSSGTVKPSAARRTSRRSSEEPSMIGAHPVTVVATRRTPIESCGQRLVTDHDDWLGSLPPDFPVHNLWMVVWTAGDLHVPGCPSVPQASFRLARGTR